MLTPSMVGIKAVHMRMDWNMKISMIISIKTRINMDINMGKNVVMDMGIIMIIVLKRKQ